MTKNLYLDILADDISRYAAIFHLQPNEWNYHGQGNGAHEKWTRLLSFYTYIRKIREKQICLSSLHHRNLTFLVLSLEEFRTSLKITLYYVFFFHVN